MSKITDEIVEQEHHFIEDDYTFVQNALIILSVIIAAIFIGEIFFGKNSLEVYHTLQNEKIHFKKKIKKIQNENASLQREYFELKSLQPKEN
jgi:cell division protein FtsB